MNESQRVNNWPRPTLDAYVKFASEADHTDKAVTEIEGDHVKSTAFGRFMQWLFESSRQPIVENFKTALKAKYPLFALAEVPKGPLTGAVIKQVVSKAEAERKSKDNLEAMVLLAKTKADVAQKAAVNNLGNPYARRAEEEAKAAADKVDAIVNNIKENKFDASQLDELIQEAENWTTVASSKAAVFGGAIDIDAPNSDNETDSSRSSGDFNRQVFINLKRATRSPTKDIDDGEQSDFPKGIQDVHALLTDANSLIDSMSLRTDQRGIEDSKQQARYEDLTKLAQAELEHPPITTLQQEDLQLIQDISDAIILTEKKLFYVLQKLHEQLIQQKGRAFLLGVHESKNEIAGNDLESAQTHMQTALKQLKYLKADDKTSTTDKKKELAQWNQAIEDRFSDFQKAINSPVPQSEDDDWTFIESDSSTSEEHKTKIRETCSACASLLDGLYVLCQKAVELQQVAENNALLAARVGRLVPRLRTIVIPEKTAVAGTIVENGVKEKITPFIIKERSLTAAEMSQGFNNHLHNATILVEREKKEISALRGLIASAQNLEQLTQVVYRGYAILKKEEKNTLATATRWGIEAMRKWLKPLYNAAKKTEDELDEIKKSLKKKQEVK